LNTLRTQAHLQVVLVIGKSNEERFTNTIEINIEVSKPVKELVQPPLSAPMIVSLQQREYLK